MKVNSYRVLEECIERGVRGALMNNDSLSFEYSELEGIVDTVSQRIMNEVADYFNFAD